MWQMDINVPQFHRRGSHDGFLAPALVRMGPDGPCDSLGPIFKPNGRFWTHLGPNLMLLGPATTLAGT